MLKLSLAENVLPRSPLHQIKGLFLEKNKSLTNCKLRIYEKLIKEARRYRPGIYEDQFYKNNLPASRLQFRGRGFIQKYPAVGKLLKNTGGHLFGGRFFERPAKNARFFASARQ